MLRILTFSTLFPHAAKPTFGVFVEGQTLRLAARPDIELRVVAPLGIPPFPLDRYRQYAPLRELPAEEEWKGVRVYRPRFALLPAIGWRTNASMIERATRPLLSRLRDEGFGFDVIDAQFFHPCGVAAVRLAKAFGVPASIKARGSDIHYWGQKPLARRQMVEAADSAAGLLSVSEALKRDMVEIGMTADKIDVHYTGVDLDRFRPVDRAQAKAALGVTGPLIVSIGNLIPLKGHDLVIRALVDLPGVTLIVAGNGPERERLAALGTELGIADRLRLPGAIPHDDIARLLAAADVMALASEREGLANVWVEALASGTPVVASAVGGASEVIDRPEAGRLLTARTPTAIAAAIRELLADPPSPACVRAAAERFAWERNTERLYRHLARLAGRGTTA